MCDPSTATLAYASIAASVVGTGISMYGQMQAGKAASAQAAYQAGIQRNNAILAQRAADDARERGAIAERQRERETRQLIGRQRAVLAGNGVVVDQDSALDITSDSAEQGKLDALTIRSNAEREALGYEAQRSNFNSEAVLSDARGSTASSSASLGALGTLVTGAGTVSSRWYDFKYQKAI